MISKSLFFKLIKEDVKRRIWTIALAVLVFFLCYPVNCAITLANRSRNYNVSKDDFIYILINGFVGPQYIVGIFITVCAAIICGLSGFYYLHSRKKVDLYHSVPLRRETLFAVSFINGFLIFLIPYIINVILSMLVLQFNGFMCLKIMKAIFSALVINLTYFGLIYSVVVIAVMLTGNFIISCFGTGVLLLYGPLLAVLKELYYVQFFSNYYTSGSISEELLFLSPLGIYADTINQYVSGSSWKDRLLYVFLVTIVLIIFAVFLYKKRPSEAAGNAMAFNISQIIIKFLLVIPLTMGGGIIFRETAGNDSDGWLIFGLIFTLLIVYGIIEIIYNFDIKKAFYHKKQLILCSCIVAAVVVIFRFDLFRFDSYIPDENKIKSMSVAVSGLDNNLRYLETGSRYISGNQEYQLKHMELNNYKTAYTLAKIGVEQPVADNVSYIYYNNVSDSFSYNVKYTLKSGREVYRTYHLSKTDSFNMLAEIFDDTDYKVTHYPIYEMKAENLSDFSCYNMVNSKSFSLDDNEKVQFIELYKDDLNHLTLEQMVQDKPIATLNFLLNGERSMEYNIFPTFEKTLNFLKEHGFDALNEVNNIDIKNIYILNQQTSYNNQVTTNADKETTKLVSDDESHISANYSDKDKIKEIYANLIPQDYYWNNRTILNAETILDVTVTIQQDDYGNEVSYTYYFEKNKIPDFVKQDLKYMEE